MRLRPVRLPRQTTPLVDVAKAWACWAGHFGVATRTEIGAAKLKEGSIQPTIDANYDVELEAIEAGL